jgi:hypothetical protein
MADQEKAPDFSFVTKPGEAAAKPQRAEGTPAFGFADKATPDVERDWGEASWGDVLSSGIRNAPASAMHQLTAIPEALMNPTQTWEGMKMVGRGIGAKTGLGGSDNAAQRQQDEAVVNALIAPYTSMAGLKKSLATDPFEVLSTAGMALSGGATGLGKVGTTLAQTGTKAGEIGSKAAGIGAKGLEALSYAADPTKSVLGAAGLAGEKVVMPAIKNYAAAASDVPKATMEKAFEAGAGSNEAIKKGFNDYAKGVGDPVDFSRSVSKAAEKSKAAEISEWVKNKDNLAELGKEVDLKPIYAAIEAERKRVGPIAGSVGKAGPTKLAHDALDEIEAQLRFRDSLPAGDPLKTVAGLDQLKQELMKEARKNGSSSVGDAYKKAWAGTRESLAKTSPGYMDLMSKYEDILEGVQNIEKNLGTGKNVSANAELAKFIRQMGSQHGPELIEKLAKYDETIPYKVAGASIYNLIGHPSTWDRATTFGHLGNLGYAASTFNVPHMLAAIGAMAAHKGLGSPTVVGMAPYYAGEVAGSKAGKAIGAAADVAGEARPLATSGLMQLQNAVTDVTGEEPRPLTIRPGRDYRPGRATGGRIMDAEAISNRLVRQADQIKKEVSNHTEKLLDTPDDHVAKALEIANRHI